MPNFNLEFPIRSQTSDQDKNVLLQLRAILQVTKGYRYLEIGSFLGGSLTPFLKDPICISILSIDDRDTMPLDERGLKFDYGGITHESMIENLNGVGLDTEKIEAFNGSVSDYPAHSHEYDLIFIDGEHTDWAAFRDFIHSEKLRSKNAIVAFHDSTFIYKSLKIINELLKARGDIFTFIKVKDSEMSLIAFNKYAQIDMTKYFKIEENLEQFYKKSEEQMLLTTVKNRVGFNFFLKEMIPTKTR